MRRIFLSSLVFLSSTICYSQIFVNQAGYIPNLPKYFYTTINSDSFHIFQSGTGNKIFSQELLFSVSNDPATGLTLYRGDFSELQSQGSFVIIINSDSSEYFSIAPTAFNDAYRKSLKSYYYQRCGITLFPNYAGAYFHPLCHANDGYYHSSTNQTGYRATTGGWHDAGDYGKYIVNAGITAGTLLMAYETFSEKFSMDDLNIPESGNGIPDILDEVKFELEWFLKMQNDNGGVYFKLTKTQFEPFIMPNNDSGARYIYEISSTATGNFVAIMAKAARIFQQYDSAFADQCLQAAILGWSYLTANPTIIPPGGFVNPSGTSTGQYGDNVDTDERLWAACELFEATGESGYHNYIVSNYNVGGIINSTQGWRNVKNLGLLTYLFSNQSNASSTLKNNIRSSLVSYCNSLVARVSNNGFGVSINPGEYNWGSNSDVLNKALLLIYGYKETNNINYYESALMQLNYILGCNAHNISFLTGVGSNSVMNPHHRPSASDGITDPIPGLLAGGPDQYLSDPTLQSLFNSSTPPALCYVDDVDSYASNEIAINWNAPLVFVLGYFNGEGTTGIEDMGNLILPDKFILEQNYPNPFNPITKIEWQSPIDTHQTLKVYDIIGNEIATLVDEYKPAGKYNVLFSIDDLPAGRKRLTSGVYFYGLQAGDFIQTRKMILLK